MGEQIQKYTEYAIQNIELCSRFLLEGKAKKALDQIGIAASKIVQIYLFKHDIDYMNTTADRIKALKSLILNGNEQSLRLYSIYTVFLFLKEENKISNEAVERLKDSLCEFMTNM